MEFDAIAEPDGDPSEGRWMVVRGTTVLDSHPDEAVGVDHHVVTGLNPGEPAHVIARAEGVTYWAVGVPDDTPPPEGYEFRDLYSLHAVAGATEWALAGRAVQIVDWARTHRFCGRCGSATDPQIGERAVRCPACALVAYPRLAPAVITLVHRGNEALLAMGTRFRRPMYSCLAGFVEPGETLEHAVRREVFEEVGVRVGRVSYQGSQPWPFPNSLMVGFRAEWEEGEIAIDEQEIAQAGWYRYDELPPIPPPISIAYRLIMDWVEGRA